MILTLCGSTRFEKFYHEANKQLGLAGHICFSLMTFPSVEGSKSWYTPEQKWTLDLAHLAKIESSDGVVMLNIEGYLGESSLRELEWARIRGKRIFWTIRDDRIRANESFARWLIHPHDVTFSNWTELFAAVEARHVLQSRS
jgi:hypothetical protein